MSTENEKVIKMLREARDATLPSKEGFENAFSAVPAYQEYMKKEVLAHSSYSIDEHVLEFLRNRLRNLRTVTLMTADGIVLVFDSVISTGQYIAKVFSRVLVSIAKSDRED